VLFPRFKKDVCPEPDITDPIYDDRVFMKLQTSGSKGNAIRSGKSHMFSVIL